MSSRDFYAAKDDLIQLLDFIWNETDCQIYESYSQYEQQLRRFDSTADLLAAFPLGECKTRSAQVLLQLYSPSAKGRVQIETIHLKPEKCRGHTLRYRISGWGLIQLYLGGIFEPEKKIVHSHLGHNSETRARKWAPTYPEAEKPEEWDWKALSSVSRKIVSHINRKLSNTKEGSRPILSNAAAYVDAGYGLL